jgi:hypothetical protein
MSLHLPLLKAILSLITLAGDWHEHKFDKFCHDAWHLLHQDDITLDEINSLYDNYMGESIEELRWKIKEKLKRVINKIETVE